MSPLSAAWPPAAPPRAEEGDTAPTRFDDQLAAQLLGQRIVLLGTQVDEVSANRVCAQLLILSAEDPRTDISLYVNSPGGSVHAGLAIYDTMRLIPNDVSTLAMGFAASMGQFLLSVGAPGKRYALPHARIMMHQPSAGIGGTTADIEIQAENLEFTKRTIERITAEHTGQSRRRSPATATATAGSRPRRPRSTAWWTTWSRRSPTCARRPPGDGRGCDMGSYTIPNVIERTLQGERSFDVFSRLLNERIIFLGTDIDDGVANVVIAQLLHLESAAPEHEIAIYINSPGGSFTSLMAIYDTMTFVQAPISTFCVGQAASTAAVLLAGGDPGRRFVLEHARVLLGQPASGGSRGTVADLSLQAKEMVRIRAQVEEVLSRHTHHDVATLRADMDRDKVFTAQEAVAYGLADEVLSRRLMMV